MSDEKEQKTAFWKVWKRQASAEEKLDRLRLAMCEEALKLERARCKRKRTYEV